MAMRYKADSLEPFDLLTELGKDCVGAIQLLPQEDMCQALGRYAYGFIKARELSALRKEMKQYVDRMEAEELDLHAIRSRSGVPVTRCR